MPLLKAPVKFRLSTAMQISWAEILNIRIATISMRVVDKWDYHISPEMSVIYVSNYLKKKNCIQLLKPFRYLKYREVN